MSMMQRVIAQMSEEHSRIEKFLKALDAGDGERSTRASIRTPVLVILTENHGHFTIDQAEIIKLLQNRRDEYAKELKDHTALGEDIRALRPSLVGST